MNSISIKKYFSWIAILVLGTVAITLSSYPLVFRYIFIGSIFLLLIIARLIPSLKEYGRILDAFFIVVLVYFLPLARLVAHVERAGERLFFVIFGKNSLVEMVAANSMSGIIWWILLPIILILIEGNSPKDIFIKKGKKKGWIIGTLLLLIFIISAFTAAFMSRIEMNVYLSLLPLGITFALINSIKEEVLYRGLLFSRTLRFGFIFALICQFLWFGLIHMLYSGGEGMGFPGLIMGGILGLILAWLTKKFDSLACPILIHMGLDFVLFMTVMLPQLYSRGF